MKIKTPDDLAKEGVGKAKFTLYLDVKAMEYIQKCAHKAGTSTSRIVNSAILSYIEALKESKNS